MIFPSSRTLFAQDPAAVAAEARSRRCRLHFPRHRSAAIVAAYPGRRAGSWNRTRRHQRRAYSRTYPKETAYWLGDVLHRLPLTPFRPLSSQLSALSFPRPPRRGEVPPSRSHPGESRVITPPTVGSAERRPTKLPRSDLSALNSQLSADFPAPPVGRGSTEPFASRRMTRQQSTSARLRGASPYCLPLAAYPSPFPFPTLTTIRFLGLWPKKSLMWSTNVTR